MRDYTVVTGGMGHSGQCDTRITVDGEWRLKCTDMAGGPLDAPEYIAAGGSEPMHYGRGPSVRVFRGSKLWIDSQGRLNG